MKELYVAVDGDDVGRRLEYFMLVNDRETLNSFSSSYGVAMNWLETELINQFGATIIFSGGDNLLASIQVNDKSVESLERLRVKFAERSKSTLSVGLGNNLQQAYFALKLAKASGKN